jgi:superfamily II DNA or RNA helicase
MILRPYQTEAVDAAVERLILADEQRQLVVLPTAAGKTVIFSELPKYFAGQTLVVAHRRELIKQAALKLAHANPDLHVAVEMADDRAHAEADVIVASVQTLAGKRKQKFDPKKFGLVIVDEAHHCAKENSYHTLLKHLGVFDEGGPKLLGVTATPYRTSGESLATFFDGVAYEKPLLEMIDEGWVSPLAAYAVYTKTSLDKVGTKGGDFKEGELSEAVNTEQRNLEIVRAWQKLASERRSTLVFAVDVEHAKALVVCARAAGVTAELVLGETPDAERAETFRRFLAGECKWLVNVGVATEGTDLPPVDCVLLARPTKSSLLITQMVGRGLRLWCPQGCADRKCAHPDSKQDALIIDLVDNTSRHKLATSATVLGLGANVNAKGKDLRVLRKALRDFGDENPGVDLAIPKEITLEWIETQRRRIQDLMKRSTTEVHSHQVNLLGAADPSIKKISDLMWIKGYDGTLRLRIPPTDMKGDQGWVEVRPDASGHFTVKAPDEPVLGTFPSQDSALRIADKLVRDKYWDRMKLLDGTASWLKDPASNSQRDLIRSLGGTATETMTKGDAKRAIDSLRAVKDQRNSGPCTSRQAYALRRMGHNPAGYSFRQASTIIAQSRNTARF